MTSLKINTSNSSSPKWEEVELPEDFLFTLISENVIFTKSSEYTYECNIPLVGYTKNKKIFNNIQRVDVKKKTIKFDCLLTVDNRYIIDKGIAIVTEITPKSVSLQLLGGNSEVNFRTKLDKLYIDKVNLGNAMDDINNLKYKYPDEQLQTYPRTIEGLRKWVKDSSSKGMITREEPEQYEVFQTGMIADIAMRTSDEFPFVMLPAIDPNNNNRFVNIWTNIETPNRYWCCNHPRIAKNVLTLDQVVFDAEEVLYCPQPFIVTIIDKVIKAIGYDVDYNEIRETNFKNVYICNTTPTVLYRQMLPHWSINKFLEEIENFFGCVFLFKKDYKVDIILKKNYFKNSEYNVIKEILDETWNAEPWSTDVKDTSTATIKFKMQNEDLMDMFDEKINGNAHFINNNNPGLYFADKKDPSLHNSVIERTDNTQWIAIGENKEAEGEEPAKKATAIEANQLRKLDRGEESEEIELSICPATYKCVWGAQQVTTDHTGRAYRMIPFSNSFIVETNNINIEKYIDDGEFESGDEDGVIVVAIWDGIDKMPTFDHTINSIPYYLGWSHGYDKENWYRAKGMFIGEDLFRSNIMPEFRRIALRLIDVDDMATLGNTFYGEGRDNEKIEIDTSICFEYEFVDNNILFDLRKPFIIRNQKYIGFSIETKFDNYGMRKIKKGKFYKFK